MVVLTLLEDDDLESKGRFSSKESVGVNPWNTIYIDTFQKSTRYKRVRYTVFTGVNKFQPRKTSSLVSVWCKTIFPKSFQPSAYSSKDALG